MITTLVTVRRMLISFFLQCADFISDDDDDNDNDGDNDDHNDNDDENGDSDNNDDLNSDHTHLHLHRFAISDKRASFTFRILSE